MSLTLYSFAGDFRALKAHIAAAYNELTLVRKDSSSQEEASAFAGKSPLGKLPVLETESGTLFESNAIARYIARLRRDSDLYGATFFESAQGDSWLDFASDLELGVSLWAYPVLGYLTYNPELYAKGVSEVTAALQKLEAHLLSRTYLVGNKVTLADIVVASALFYPFKFLLGPDARAPVPSVVRWFVTLVNQPAFKSVLGPVSLAEEEMLAAGAPAPAKSGKPAGGKKASAAAPAPAGEGKKEKAPKEKAAKAPAPAPAPVAAPAPAEEEEEEAPKPKTKGPFDDLPKSPMDMDKWKRTYSNSRSDYYLAMKPFWEEQFDAEGYSIWFCKYKYNEENTVDFKTSNLVGGYLQRCEELRRYAFGSMVILNETAPFEIEGCWLIRGQDIKPMLDCNDAAEHFEWTKVDTTDPAVRALVGDYWCSSGDINGKYQMDFKLFK